jgi:hypothetical protein
LPSFRKILSEQSATQTSGFETKKAAERAMAEALVKIDRGVFVEASKQTLSDYLDLRRQVSGTRTLFCHVRLGRCRSTVDARRNLRLPRAVRAVCCGTGDDLATRRMARG